MIGDKPQKIIPPSGNVAAEFMQKLFFQTEQRIIAEITRKRNQGFVDYSEHATLRRVQQILRDMVDDSEKYVPQMMAYPFMTGKGTFKGYGSAEEIIQRTDAETRRLIEQLSDNLLGEITEAAATAYQSSADLITAQNALKAAENGKTLIGRHSPDIYRKNVLTGVLTTTATGAGPLTSVEAVARSIEKEGIPAFIDRAGRKWSLRDYGNMATRTTFRQAQTAAEPGPIPSICAGRMAQNRSFILARPVPFTIGLRPRRAAESISPLSTTSSILKTSVRHPVRAVRCI